MLVHSHNCSIPRDWLGQAIVHISASLSARVAAPSTSKSQGVHESMSRGSFLDLMVKNLPLSPIEGASYTNRNLTKE